MTKLPSNSFAREAVKLKGDWTWDDLAKDVARLDGVSMDEAHSRLDLALRQRITRSNAQKNRHQKARKDATARIRIAKIRILATAGSKRGFRCADDLLSAAKEAGWEYEDTGRAMRELVMPLENQGLLQDLRDANDLFYGYGLTEAGKEYLDELQSQ